MSETCAKPAQEFRTKANGSIALVPAQIAQNVCLLFLRSFAVCSFMFPFQLQRIGT
jgi:hypothetical protein